MPAELLSLFTDETLSPEGLPLYATHYSNHNKDKCYGFVKRPDNKYLPEKLQKINGDIFVHDSALVAGQRSIGKGLQGRQIYQPDDFKREIVVLEITESQNANTGQPSLKATKIAFADDYRAYLAKQEKQKQIQAEKVAKEADLQRRLEVEKKSLKKIYKKCGR